jgi:hypothetical protein
MRASSRDSMLTGESRGARLTPADCLSEDVVGIAEAREADFAVASIRHYSARLRISADSGALQRVREVQSTPGKLAGIFLARGGLEPPARICRAGFESN